VIEATIAAPLALPTEVEVVEVETPEITTVELPPTDTVPPVRRVELVVEAAVLAREAMTVLGSFVSATVET
jgi:hypothetical protein